MVSDSSTNLLLLHQPKTFPVEVIYEVFQYADKKHLPSLALTCRRYQQEAERLLYERITIWQLDKANRGCLSTLTTVPRKALLVRWFWIFWRDPASTATLRLLANTLLALTSLKLLHLRPQTDRIRPVQNIIGSCLKRCTFSLETLFISDYLDLAEWAPRQPSLNCVGIVVTRNFKERPEQLSVYQKLLQGTDPNRSLNLWRIAREGTGIDTIHGYPVFAHGWDAKPIRESMKHMVPIGCIYRFELHLQRLSDQDVLKQVLASIAQNFPRVSDLRIIVRDHDLQANPHGFSSSLSQLPELTGLEMDYHDGDSSPQQSFTRLGPLWAAQCQKLRRIDYPDGSFWTSRAET